jgi:hypothetical protein
MGNPEPIPVPPGTDHVPNDFAKDFRALLDAPSIELHIPPTVAWQIMSVLQLALRHPNLRSGPVRTTAEEFARALQERVSTTPALRRVAEQGWEEIE